MKQIKGGDDDSGSAGCSTGLSCSCHAHVNANGSVHSYGWNSCGGDNNPAGTTCKNYCCSATASGGYC